MDRVSSPKPDVTSWDTQVSTFRDTYPRTRPVPGETRSPTSRPRRPRVGTWTPDPDRRPFPWEPASGQTWGFPIPRSHVKQGP